MEKALRLILFLFFSFAFNHYANASRLLGADIQWKSLGNDSYQVTIRVYRDCKGPATTPMAAIISSDSCSSNYSFSAGPGNDSMRDITPACNAFGKPCNPQNTMISTSLPLAIEEHAFTFIIYLGGSRANCCWYKISWSDSARSSAITTGSPGNLTMESWLNRCLTSQDNSPQFGGDPLMIKCAGQDVVFDNSVTDPDNDSLSYALAPPIGFSYNSPYSYTYPLTCLSGSFSLNSVTGAFIFRPLQMQVTVIKAEVTEWRKVNGVYTIIGKNSRDVQFAILGNCNNKIPTLSGPYNYEVCANSQICFTINSNDQDATDSTKVTWNNGISAATFSSNNGSARLASGTFCWTPSDSDVSNMPHIFSVTAKDNKCPLVGDITRSYSIVVNPVPKANRIITKTGCSTFNFEAQTVLGLTNPTYKWFIPASSVTAWSNGATATYHFSTAGVYPVHLRISAKGCQTDYYDTVKVDPMVEISIPNDTTVCGGKMITLMSTMKGGNSPFHYLWSTGVSDTNASVTFVPIPNRYYYVTVVDRDSCYTTDSVYVRALQVVASNDAFTCKGKSITLTSTRINGTAPFHYSWSSGSLDTNATVIVTPSTSRYYYVTVYDKDGCSSTDSVYVTVKPLPVIKPDTDIVLCFGTKIILDAGLADATYTWYADGLQMASTQKITVSFPGKYSVHVVDSFGCEAFDTVTVHANPKIDTLVTKSGNTLISNASGVNYQWVICPSYTSLPGDTSKIFEPVSNGDYAVIVSQNGCTDTSDCFTIAGLGFDKNFSSDLFHISPNPNHGVFDVFISGYSKEMRIEIFNSLGDLVFTQTGATGRNTIELINHADGVYFVKVYGNTFISIQKIIKQ